MSHVSAEVAAAAVVESWERLVAAIPGGWIRAESGVLAAVTGMEEPTLNGVWVTGEAAQSAVVGDMLTEVAATGLPYCLQVRPEGAEKLTWQAVAQGMGREDDIPLMVLEGPRGGGTAQSDEELLIRELAPSEASAHALVAAAGFEGPEEVFLRLMTPSVMAAPGVRCYLGELDGQAVATGVGVTLGDSVGIFSVATPPAYRRRGYGGAVTARAVADSFAVGAKWAWLQSSPSGYHLYENLGFRTVESWPCWLSTIAPS